MDEIGSETSKGKTRGFTNFEIDLIYYINNNIEKKGKLELLNFNYDYKKILYKEITYSFYFFLKRIQKEQNELTDIDLGESTIIESEFLDIKPININFDYIRFFDGDGWILLEEDDVIQLNNKKDYNNLKILIKAEISSEDKIKLEDKYKNINKEMEYIDFDLKNKNSIHYVSDAPLNLIVLTANPLMDNEKELRTLNDFNKIPSTIYKLFKEEDYLKYTEFLPLTMNTLEGILIDKTRRPVILHLICKSVYIDKNFESENNNNDKESKNNSELFTNLIFEKDEDENKDEDDKVLSKYYLEFIDKNKLANLKKWIDSDKNLQENIGKITLIISTQLAENVFDLFKDFGFKNLIVQHTTLADLKFVVKFNYTFYKELIIRKCLPINELYEMALNIYMEKEDPPTFCCCFHKHKNKCNFLEDIKNELYFDNKERNDVDSLKNTLPHFYHLFPECKPLQSCYTEIWSDRGILLNNAEKYFEYSFSFHKKGCVFRCNSINKKNIIKLKTSDDKEKTFYNLCCCNEPTEKHNRNYVFIKYFTKDKINNKIGFKPPETMKEKKFFPDYEKMELLVGKNSIVFDLIKFFYSKEQYYNIYDDKIEKIENLESFESFVKAVIEYYKYKNYYLYEPDEEEKDVQLKKIKSSPQIALRKLLSGISNNDNIKSKNSELIPDISTEKKIDFIEIKLKENEIINEDMIYNFMNDNKIIFIYVYDTELLSSIKKTNQKIIFLSNKKLEQLKFIKNFKKLTLNPPNDYNNHRIEFQHKKTTRDWRIGS